MKQLLVQIYVPRSRRRFTAIMTTDDIDRFDEKFWDTIYNTDYASLINLIETSKTFSDLKSKINLVRKNKFSNFLGFDGENKDKGLGDVWDY